MYILYIIFAILIFSFLIAIHEFGHFITAKLFGVKVNEFSICMGPAIWKKQKGETLYAIRCIPIGGYCAMEGEDGDSDDPRAFGNAKWWKKLIILVAGAAMNLIAGLVLMILLVGLSSDFSTIAQPVLESVEPGSSLEGYFQPGDRIYEIDGERVYTENDITFLLSLNLSGRENIHDHDVTVIRDGEKVYFDDLNMEPRELPSEDGTTSLRYGMNLQREERNLGNTLSFAWNGSLNYGRTVRLSLQMLFRGDAGLDDMSGPVGIVKTIADVGTQTEDPWLGFWNVISLGALIAINLGLMNLLPIPALDGGRVVGVVLTGAIEGITRKKLNPKVEGYVHGAGMILLLLLMALIMLKDVIGLFG